MPYVWIGLGLLLVIRSLPARNTLQFGELTREEQKAWLMRPLQLLNILRTVLGVGLMFYGISEWQSQ